MRLQFYGFTWIAVVAVMLLFSLMGNVIAQPVKSGGAWAVTEYGNPVCTSIKTKSGVELVFTDLIQSFIPSSSHKTACGWFLVSHHYGRYYTPHRGSVLHYWKFAHGICLPIVGCIIDQQLDYDAGVFVKIIRICKNNKYKW